MQDTHNQRRECSCDDYHCTRVTLTCYARIKGSASNTRGILDCLLYGRAQDPEEDEEKEAYRHNAPLVTLVDATPHQEVVGQKGQIEA